MRSSNIGRKIDLSLRNMAWMVDRFIKRWNVEIEDLTENIDNSKPNEDDFIYAEVKDEVERIIVKDEDPDEATIIVHGIQVKKKIVHRKSEKYNGADVFFKVEKLKFALVQFKLASVDRFHFDEAELSNLEKFCKFCDGGKCPIFVWLIRYHGDEYTKHRILKVCDLRKILKGRKSAHIKEFIDTGMTRNKFLKELVDCEAGAPFDRKPTSAELVKYAGTLNRLIVDYTVQN